MTRAVAAGLAAALALVAPAAAQDIPTDGQAEVVWTIRVPGGPTGWVNAVTPMPDGSFVAVGFTGRDDAAEGEDWQGFALAFDAEGKTRWLRRYGAGARTDALWDVERAADGTMLGVGFTDRTGAGGLDGWIVRLDAQGVFMGELAVGGPGYDRLTDIAPAGDGGFVAVGFTSVEGQGRQVLIVRLDSIGMVKWRKAWGGPSDETGLYVEPTADGGFVIAGGAAVGGQGDVLVLKVDAAGEEVWQRTFGQNPGLDVPHGLAVLPDGRIRMAGYIETPGQAGVHDLLALTLSPRGDILVREVFGGAGDDRAMVSGLDAEGRDWLTGYSRSGAGGGWDIFLTRLDRDGRFEGPVAILGGAGDENGTVVRPLPGGDLLVGAYAANATGGQDPVILRVKPRLGAATERFRRR